MLALKVQDQPVSICNERNDFNQFLLQPEDLCSRLQLQKAPRWLLGVGSGVKHASARPHKDKYGHTHLISHGHSVCQPSLSLLFHVETQQKSFCIELYFKSHSSQKALSWFTKIPKRLDMQLIEFIISLVGLNCWWCQLLSFGSRVKFELS